MNINNFGVIKSLITGLESSQIEFKETTGQLMIKDDNYNSCLLFCRGSSGKCSTCSRRGR